MTPTTITATDPIVLGPITVTFSVDAEAPNGSVTVSRCDVKHGGGMPVAHSHDAFEETLYGLEGVTTLTLDGEQIELGAGDTVCIRRGPSGVAQFLLGLAQGRPLVGSRRRLRSCRGGVLAAGICARAHGGGAFRRLPGQARMTIDHRYGLQACTTWPD